MKTRKPPFGGYSRRPWQVYKNYSDQLRCRCNVPIAIVYSPQKARRGNPSRDHTVDALTGDPHFCEVGYGF